MNNNLENSKKDSRSKVSPIGNIFGFAIGALWIWAERTYDLLPSFSKPGDQWGMGLTEGFIHVGAAYIAFIIGAGIGFGLEEIFKSIIGAKKK